MLISIFISPVIATDITNVITEMQPQIVGGTNVVTLHPHYNDSWFVLCNEGSLIINVYAYNYTGNHDPLYLPSFIMSIKPNQVGVLNNNMSYCLYASYDEISDFKDVEKIKDKFNQWWIIILIGGIFLAAIYVIIRRLIK